MRIEKERNNLLELFKQTPEMLCILKGPEHVFEFVNEAHVKVLGFDATGMSVREAQPESIEVHGILDNVYQTGKTAELHEIPVTVGTKKRYFNLTYSAARDDDGRINGIMILGREITAEVEYEKAIKAALEKQRLAEERLRLALEGGRMGTWSISYPEATVHSDARFKQLHGIAENATVEEANRNHIHPEDQPKTLERLSYAIENRRPYECEYRVVHDKEVRWVYARGEPKFNMATGELESMSGITMDITQFKQATQSRDNFISIASHELKTPLTSLKLLTQIQRKLAEMENDLRAVTNYKKIDRLVSRLARLVEDMLDISRIQTGRFLIKKEDEDLTRVAKEVIERMGPNFAEAGADRISFEGPESLTGMFDAFRIDQVITNLLQNALKYADGRGVEVSIEKAKSMLRLTVSDEGRGINSEEQARIFERYERATSAVEISGLGLGLFICKQIIEAHGGRIWVESADGRGSKFIFEVPSV